MLYRVIGILILAGFVVDHNNLKNQVRANDLNNSEREFTKNRVKAMMVNIADLERQIADANDGTGEYINISLEERAVRRAALMTRLYKKLHEVIEFQSNAL